MLGFIQNLFTQNIINIGFEDVRYAIQQSSQYILINTLSNMEQDCLIHGTLLYEKEEHIINELINKNQKDKWKILLYGKNSVDTSVVKKRSQLQSLGFMDVYVYSGGLFEWLLLQDIYGNSEFPTTSRCKDFLKYRPPITISRLPAIGY
jgi:hypothetical protein